jgi:predicted dehydrogenase
MKMSKTTKIAMIGLGGYGETYLEGLMDRPARPIELVAAVDPNPERCTRLEAVRELGVTFFEDIESIDVEVDLAIISSPIHFHAPQTIQALQLGWTVMCEKPLCGTLQEARQMLQAEAEAEGFVAVGYQWSYNDAIQRFKADVLAGRFGRAIRAKTVCSWPRRKHYYQRNRWAGALKTDDGQWVLDSPAHNATSHFLHNMLYCLGSERTASAQPATVQADVCRVNPDIENFDTAAIRCQTRDGAEILFYTSHAVPSQFGPISVFDFEHAQAFQSSQLDLTVRLADGTEIVYGNPWGDPVEKVWQCIDAMQGGPPVACPISAAMPQVACINAASFSSPQIPAVPADHVEQIDEGDQQLRYAPQIQPMLLSGFTFNRLPGELGREVLTSTGQIIAMNETFTFPVNQDAYL